ncbi:single-stranded DNA-binding protein [Conexibacter sp. SYSU D00693]|uniref:single-stranded DNA-binding protein n=1 Tax=Conexibacter sp. SYSU D00693 TaxID=2812560 RepID=UPI00196A99A0|nr:single-stranded DNA-binding protein [Conexibacter sp. SYSU D00693]
MAGTNINRVVLTGNLTRDPELRSLPSGTQVCTLRIASNSRRKDASGEWVDKPNYFDVTVWGAQGENCARYLSKGRPIAVDGRLEWREYTTQEGQKRQAVDIVADAVQFLGGRDDAPMGGGGGGFTPQRSDVPTNTDDFAPVGGGGGGGGGYANGGGGGFGGGGQQGGGSFGGGPADDDIPF